jgi:hypothetical protein
VRQESRESLRAWVGQARPDFEGRGSQYASTRVQISPAARQSQSAEADALKDSTDAAEHDPFILLIKRMVEMLTGKPVHTFNAKALGEGGGSEHHEHSQHAAEAPQARAGFGVEYDYHAVHEESEQTTFSAQGVIKTADGREISFQLDLTMSRQYREETNISVRAGDAQRKDPLVINFDGNATQLSDQRFRFDLNADGTAEEVPLLASGSGYLALDRNGNGRIDSGAELFGPGTGSGFKELASLDQDHNGWIDENDAAYSKLRVWTPDGSGQGSLASLQERQVGALYLGNLATPFELRGQGNADLGGVSATGLYLREDGSAGTVQEIDLTV